MNLDEKIILFLYERYENKVLLTTTEIIINNFSNYSKGYVFERICALEYSNYTRRYSSTTDYRVLTNTGIKWAIELKDKEGE